LQSARLMGMTHFDPTAADAPHRVAVEVDVEPFFAEYFSVFE